MNIPQQLKENHLAVVVALLLIGAAAAIPSIASLKDNVFVSIACAAAAAFAGALLGKAFESRDEFELRAAKRYSERLNPINRNIASTTKELRSIVLSVQSNQCTPQDAIRLIGQLSPNLIGAMTDIGELTGERFDPNTIYQTAHQIQELDKLLGSLGKISGDKGQLLVDQVRSTLAAIHPDVYKRVGEIVHCPHCEAENQILIGKRAPASATCVCVNCSKTFHAHRAADFRVFTNAPGIGSGEKLDSVAVQLPCACGNTMEVRLNSKRPRNHVCLACGQNYWVDYPDKIQKKAKLPIISANLEPSDLTRGEIHCDEHDAWLPILHKSDALVAALCKKGPHVVQHVKRNANHAERAK